MSVIRVLFLHTSPLAWCLIPSGPGAVCEYSRVEVENTEGRGGGGGVGDCPSGGLGALSIGN